jgi:hypothetical protein
VQADGHQPAGPPSLRSTPPGRSPGLGRSLCRFHLAGTTSGIAGTGSAQPATRKVSFVEGCVSAVLVVPAQRVDRFLPDGKWYRHFPANGRCSGCSQRRLGCTADGLLLALPARLQAGCWVRCSSCPGRQSGTTGTGSGKVQPGRPGGRRIGGGGVNSHDGRVAIPEPGGVSRADSILQAFG